MFEQCSVQCYVTYYNAIVMTMMPCTGAAGALEQRAGGAARERSARDRRGDRGGRRARRPRDGAARGKRGCRRPARGPQQARRGRRRRRRRGRGRRRIRRRRRVRGVLSSAACLPFEIESANWCAVPIARGREQCNAISMCYAMECNAMQCNLECNAT